MSDLFEQVELDPAVDGGRRHDGVTDLAVVATQPATHAFGHRTGRIRDPFGNIWWITAVVEAVSPEEFMRRLPETTYAHAMSDAQQTLDRELSGRDRDHGSASRPVTR
jgi:PhnB protein